MEIDTLDFKSKPRIGLMSVGHKVYWDQFDGLLKVLEEKITIIEKKINNNTFIELINLGIADDSISAYKILADINKLDLDLLFIDMETYAVSSTFAPIIQKINIPVVIIAVQPEDQFDYVDGTIFNQLYFDVFCAVPEFMAVAERMGKKLPPVILGTLHDEEVDLEINRWCKIARVISSLKNARIGLMGHVLECMYDMHTDPTIITKVFGCHAVQLELEDVMSIYNNVASTEIDLMTKRILAFFKTPEPGSDPVSSKLNDEDLFNAAKTAVALEKFIEKYSLTGMAYYYEAADNIEMSRLVSNFIVGNSILCTKGFPMCGEYDLKTCIAMLIMDRLDIGGSFAEFHTMDFKNDTILVGHDGPHHFMVSEGKPSLRSLRVFHGKPGSGAGVEFQLKEGPITMLGISLDKNYDIKFIVAEGQSIKRPIPPTGNTNTHGYFNQDLKTFLTKWVNEGPTHHFSLGVGHHAKTIKYIADVYGCECVVVTD